jgi:nitroreductase
VTERPDHNPRNDAALSFLLSRASAARFEEPAPKDAEIDLMLRAAVTAADHGRIRPWRFIVMEGEGRKRLSALMVEALRARSPNASEDELKKEGGKVLRAPVVIALIAKPDRAHKVPVDEQIQAVAAAGAHLMLAANALGYGCAWKTGLAATDPIVRNGLGFGDGDSIIGFFYIGTNPQIGAPLPRATIEGVAEFWKD